MVDAFAFRQRNLARLAQCLGVQIGIVVAMRSVDNQGTSMADFSSLLWQDTGPGGRERVTRGHIHKSYRFCLQLSYTFNTSIFASSFGKG